MASIKKQLSRALEKEFIEGTVFRVDLDRVDVAPAGSSGILRSLPLTGDRDKVKPGDRVRVLTVAGERVAMVGDVAQDDSPGEIVEDASEVETAERMALLKEEKKGGAARLAELEDVDTQTVEPADANVLKYDAASGKWVPGEGGGSTASDENSPVVARARGSQLQVIPHNVVTVLDYNDIVYDTDNAITTGTGWRFTCPPGKDGYYKVDASILMSSTTAWALGEYLHMILFKNGVTHSALWREQRESAAGVFNQAQGSDIVHLAYGDYIQIALIQTSGGDLTTHNNSSYNYVSITRLASYERGGAAVDHAATADFATNAGKLDGTQIAAIVSGENTTKTTLAGDFNAPLPSGFYDALDATGAPSNNWWHLINSRHRAEGTNYALQLANKFFDNDLYTRVISNGVPGDWGKVWTSVNAPRYCGFTVSFDGGGSPIAVGSCAYVRFPANWTAMQLHMFCDVQATFSFQLHKSTYDNWPTLTYITQPSISNAYKYAAGLGSAWNANAGDIWRLYVSANNNAKIASISFWGYFA